MEVRRGYKQTEVGAIPNDWEIRLLNDLSIKIGSGITPTGGEAVYKKEGRPLVRSQNVGWGKLLLDNIAFIDEETHLSFVNTEVELNDVLLNISGASIGRSSFATQKLVGGNVNQHVCIIRPVKTILNHVFLNMFLLSRYGQKQIDSFQSGGNRQGLNIGQIKTFQIPFPSTQEQTAIATALSDTDALISSLEKLIAKKRNIKQGAMQELLKPKKGWELKRLGDVADVTKLAGYEYSKHFNSYEDGGEIIVIRGTNITHNKMDLSDVKNIPRAVSNYLIRSKLNKGDLVFAYVGTIGPVYLVNENDKYHLGPNTSKITAKNQISPEFLLIYFKSSFIQNEIVEHTSVGAQPSLSMQKIRRFKINFPTKKDDQNNLVEIFTSIDQEIEALESKLEKYKQIKSGMMQNLLTGKIRLV